jgi:modulator of FtsH protease HflK
MRSKFDEDGSGPNISEVVAELSDVLSSNLKRFGPLLGGLVLLAVVVAGVYSVGPGEQGVVRRFGREHRTVAPGLHYALPLVEHVDVVNIEEVRRIEVGFNGENTINEEALMLTGDENIVEVQMVVQYRVADPTRFLFRLREPEASLRVAAEVALRSVVGRTSIDDVMTTGRGSVQQATREVLQALMDDYESGIEITEVKLDAVDAPDEVKDAFNAVTRAREDKEKLVNEARGYQEDKVPRARGDAQGIVRAAEAYKEQRVLRAEGDANKFNATLAEYEKARGVTRQRLYLETMERVFQPLRNKVVVDKGALQGSVPLFPLRSMSGSGAASAGSPPAAAPSGASVSSAGVSTAPAAAIAGGAP